MATLIWVECRAQGGCPNNGVQLSESISGAFPSKVNMNTMNTNVTGLPLLLLSLQCCLGQIDTNALATGEWSEI